ncbi:hypothetical protein [Nitratiruptor sp. YY08-26]|nr:hypothetical protein [Nitratiruptor sp. YY08-26]
MLVHSVDGKYVHIIDDDGNKASILKERWHEYFGKSPAEAIAKAEQATA